MNDENWKRSLETFEIAYLEHALGARRNIIQLFPQVPDKQKAWEDLVALTAKMVINEDYRVARCMPLIFSSAFPYVPDKQKAWLDITKLVNFKDRQVNEKIRNSIASVFSNSPDKEKAWADLLQLIGNENKKNLRTATEILCSHITMYKDKQKEWEDLIKLTKCEETEVKRIAVSVIHSIFPSVCDKHKAWEDLIGLIYCEDIQVKRTASSVIASNYSFAPDKQKMWKYLVKLTFDTDIQVRTIAVNALVSNFSLAPDKQKVWEDLITVISGDYQVRKIAACALKSAILIVNNKEKAWDELLGLTAHKDIDVRKHVAFALVSAFYLLSDKQKLSQDLYKCMRNKDRNVKATVASILSLVYSQLPDQTQCWEKLIELTSDEDIGVRRNAYYSLGKISIFKASQAENETVYRKEFEQAIGFFESASKESTIYNPSQFCLPFYRSFYTIISNEKQQVKDEVDKYLTEARVAIKNSKNKQVLFETVDNLAKALKEVQSFENKSLEDKKDELSHYMEYCEQAANLMLETEQTSPYATEVLKKGLPILDRKLKLLLKEIQEKAKTACRESQGTDTEEIACAVKDKVQSIEVQDIESVDPEQLVKVLEEVISVLNIKIPSIPENEFILNKLQSMISKKASTERYTELPFIISLIPTVNMMSEQSVKRELNPLSEGIKEINEKLDHVTISLKSGISQELVITAGGPIPHFSIDHVITISLQEITYPELEEDMTKIKGETIDKLSKLPKRLAEKVEEHLIQKRMYDVLKKLI